MMTPVPPKKEKEKDKGKDKEEGVSLPITLVVTLPEKATLTIDGEATVSKSARRVFVSPNLSTGKEYSYVFKAQVMQDGKPVPAPARFTVLLTKQGGQWLIAHQHSSPRAAPKN